MKLSIIRKTKDQNTKVTKCTMESLVKRISKDDAKLSITMFRQYAANKKPEEYKYYKDYDKLKAIYPAVELGCDSNNNITILANNGLLLLTFYKEGATENDFSIAKESVAALPMTFAAIKGADGKSLHVLVSFVSSEGSLPSDDILALILYANAHTTAINLYKGAIGWKTLELEEPSIMDHFITTIDEKPYINYEAVPVRVAEMQTPAYEPVGKNYSTVDIDTNLADTKMVAMIEYLTEHYDFRFNTIGRGPEYRDKDKRFDEFKAIDKTNINGLAIKLNCYGIEVSAHDVKMFVNSDKLKKYDPIQEYLYDCMGKWDGSDHIGNLAKTVPCDNPNWERWFKIWYLGMVKQWLHTKKTQYGNSVAPLIIGKQGYGKSTFCRRLLPEELAKWGYSDNVVFSDKIQVQKLMAQMLLINLDEFNQLSDRMQKGFLKNLMQLPTVKVRLPYSTHYDDLPRYASFISTSNMTDVLADESGCRRFFAIELTDRINLDILPNHTQLFAQAMQAIKNNELSYFDEEETKLVMESNRKFQMLAPVSQYFQEYFDIASSNGEGEFMSAAAIMDYLSTKVGATVKESNLINFGRFLSNIPRIISRRSGMRGTEYKVVKLKENRNRQ